MNILNTEPYILVTNVVFIEDNEEMLFLVLFYDLKLKYYRTLKLVYIYYFILLYNNNFVIP